MGKIAQFGKQTWSALLPAFSCIHNTAGHVTQSTINSQQMLGVFWVFERETGHAHTNVQVWEGQRERERGKESQTCPVLSHLGVPSQEQRDHDLSRNQARCFTKPPRRPHQRRPHPLPRAPREGKSASSPTQFTPRPPSPLHYHTD